MYSNKGNNFSANRQKKYPFLQGQQTQTQPQPQPKAKPTLQLCSTNFNHEEQQEIQTHQEEVVLKEEPKQIFKPTQNQWFDDEPEFVQPENYKGENVNDLQKDYPKVQDEDTQEQVARYDDQMKQITNQTKDLSLSAQKKEFQHDQRTEQPRKVVHNQWDNDSNGGNESSGNEEAKYGKRQGYNEGKDRDQYYGDNDDSQRKPEYRDGTGYENKRGYNNFRGNRYNSGQGSNRGYRGRYKKDGYRGNSYNKKFSDRLPESYEQEKYGNEQQISEDNYPKKNSEDYSKSRPNQFKNHRGQNRNYDNQKNYDEDREDDYYHSERPQYRKPNNHQQKQSYNQRSNQGKGLPLYMPKNSQQ